MDPRRSPGGDQPYSEQPPDGGLKKGGAKIKERSRTGGPLTASVSSPVVCADETVEQLVAKCGRSLVVHVPWLQHPQAANEPAVATHENREALGFLWHAPMPLFCDLGSIPLAGALDLGVGLRPRHFELHRTRVDGRLYAFAMRRRKEQR